MSYSRLGDFKDIGLNVTGKDGQMVATPAYMCTCISDLETWVHNEIQ